MSERKDPYELLGVARDADLDTLRKSYRKLARQYHPDVNPGDSDAEERFKEISVAYDILSDPERRRNYDEFGEIALEVGFDAEEARKRRDAFRTRFGGGARPEATEGEEFHFGDIDDLLGQFFSGRTTGPGGARGTAGMRFGGADLHAELELDFVDAARGGEKRLTLGRPTAGGGQAPETVTVRIPPGVDEGGRLRVPGKGAPGVGGGPPGDLWVQLRVRPHPIFRREGRDLSLDVPVHVREAMLGAKVEVPTLEGRVTLTVPPGTSSGTRLRLRGKGIPDPAGGPPGDLFACIQIRVPKKIDDAAREALERLAPFEDPDLRGDLR